MSIPITVSACRNDTRVTLLSFLAQLMKCLQQPSWPAWSAHERESVDCARSCRTEVNKPDGNPTLSTRWFSLYSFLQVLMTIVDPAPFILVLLQLMPTSLATFMLMPSRCQILAPWCQSRIFGFYHFWPKDPCIWLFPLLQQENGLHQFAVCFIS